jgi:hypothetical protein
VALAGGRHALELRLREGEECRAEDDELEEKEQVLAEALEGGVGLEVLDCLLPEERCGDFDVAPAELEKVEDEEGGDRDSRGDRADPWGEPVMGRAPG